MPIEYYSERTAVTDQETMLKLSEKFSHEIFGFRSLISRKQAVFKLSSCNLSTSSQGLPNLPVPPLNITLDTYLKSVKPFLTSEELTTTTSAIKKFALGDGQKLQTLLEKYAATKENWLAHWWLHSAYLDFRWPVVVYSNPGLVYPLQNFKSQDDQLRYAANIALGALDYKALIDNDAIPLEKMGKDPLDMNQYKMIFGTCRIPGFKRDTLSYNNSQHIAVFHKGHIFKLPMWGRDGVIINEDQIVQQFKKIIEMSQIEEKNPIGILTSEHRDTWGKIYDELLSHPKNSLSLKVVESSLFVLCLDKSYGGSDEDFRNRQNIAAGATIHGRGSSQNSCNRWFDKTVQFIIGADGINGMTYEHSPAEGQPIAVMTDHVVNYITSNKSQGLEPSASVEEIKKLEFNISSNMENFIKTAKKNIDTLVKDLELSCYTHKMYGKDFIKSQKMSPDSFIQMAMQFAFYRLHNVPAAHYESAATRKFIGGRTETIRSCSEESIKFAKTMLDHKCTPQEKVQSLHAAVKAHKDYTVKALNGLGVDRHLLGLKLIASENNIDIPEFYSDSSFVRSTHMRISSSQVAGKNDTFMCYGPLVSNGYSTCYNPRDKDMNFATAAFNSDNGTSAERYRQALEDSLVDMHNVLLKATQSKL